VSSPRNQPNNQFASNINRYFAYMALKGFGFGLIAATWLIFLQQRRGLSLTQATFVDVAFWIAAFAGEVPTGGVADAFGRKASMVAGSALMCVSIFGWVAAPSVTLIVLAYAGLAIGTTFLSGADDAFFYESLRITGRVDDYTRLIGLAGATMLGATAIGSVASGLLAAVELSWPFLVAGISLLGMLSVVLTLKEPVAETRPSAQARRSYRQTLQQSLAMMRARPALRYPLLYSALVPVAATILETFFLQPQAIALGVPIAGVGVLLMATQLTNVAGSSWENWIAARFGQGRILYSAPAIIVASLILLAAIQVRWELVFIAVISFVTALSRPLVLSRIQSEVSDDVRATILSMQSLMATLLITVSEPILGAMADRSGLPIAYVVVAIGLGLLVLALFWTSRRQFPTPMAVDQPA
jgi:MFS family permease